MPEVVGRLRTPRLASAPSSPVVGEVYYDTAANILYWWNGTAWVAASGGGAALPADTVVVAGTRVIANKLLAGDTQPSFRFFGDGKHEWGVGGTTAPDVSLYRSAASTLAATLGTLNLITSPTSFRIDNSGFQEFYAAETQPRFRLSRDAGGSGLPGLSLGLGGSTAPDVNLYRSAADNLKTDDTFWALQLVSSNGNLYCGSALDTSLSRYAAGNLLANDTLRVGTTIVIDQTYSNSTGKLYFGSDLGTALYRSSGSGAHWIDHRGSDSAWGGFNAAIFNVVSDRKLKDDVASAEVSVDQMLKAGIYTYKLHKHEGRHLGLMAEELPPELLHTSEDENESLQFVDLYKLSTAILATVQHLDERLKTLEASTVR